MTCLLEKCKTCREYSTCPLLSSTVQRSYGNRTLDAILKQLQEIDNKLEKISRNGKN